LPETHSTPSRIERAPAGDLGAVRWIEIPSNADSRGVLTAVEGSSVVPFEIKRVYFVHDVIAERGGHAHRDTQQLVVAVHGRLDVELSDGASSRTYTLDRPTRGLYVGPMLFIRLTSFAPGTVMVSIASTHYDTRRSIRSWDDYLAAIED
jgi:WxcM-like, C-terminal